ncbi:MAG: hypothetical protein WCS96_09845 [Victivallales bacterium]
MNKIQEKSSFKNKMGLSYVCGPEDWEATLGNINRNIFSGVEIPGDFLDFKNISNEFKSTGMEIFNVRDPLPQSITRTIYGQTPNIMEKIQKQLSMILKKVSGYPCPNVSIDFGIDLALENRERRDFIIAFIKQAASALYGEKVCLCLPARIPTVPPATAENYFSFLKDTMYGGIRFSADIYPHDPLRNRFLGELIRWYRFDTNIVRFVYEPEAGNLMVEKILEAWFAVLKNISYGGPVIFCPKISSSSHFIRESERLAELIKTVRSKI